MKFTIFFVYFLVFFGLFLGLTGVDPKFEVSLYSGTTTDIIPTEVECLFFTPFLAYVLLYPVGVLGGRPFRGILCGCGWGV